MQRRPLAIFFAAFALTACAGTTAQRNHSTAQVSNSSVRHVQGDEFRVVGRPDGTGEAYDATLLFDRANAAVREHRCEAALPDYDRVIREFPDTRLVAPSYFNRGVCLQSMRRFDEAASAYREAASRAHDDDLHRDALFRLAVVGEAMAQPPVVIEASNAVLALPRITIADRVEALARQAAAVLAQGDRPGARRLAERAIELVPSAEGVAALGDDTFIAQARFVGAETYRLDAAGVAINVEDPQLEQAIERRVQLVTHAHVLFNDAIRVGNPHWAAACGFSIGEMYRALYDSIVRAPAPADWDANAISVYRRRTAQRLRPLLQGALRAWEATLEMARRNGIGDNDWVRRTDSQIGDLRTLILNGGVAPDAPSNTAPQPAGTGTPGASPASSPATGGGRPAAG